MKRLGIVGIVCSLVINVSGYVLVPKKEVFGDKKPFYAVIGLPRGGTTVVSSFLGSMRDTFCLCEPVWLFINRPDLFEKGISAVTHKAQDLVITEPEQFVKEVRQYLSKTDLYTSAGIKETYNDYRSRCVDILLDNGPDFTVFVWRHPKATFHAWKTIWWGYPFNDVKFLIKNYKELVAKRMKCKNAVDIVYEEFTKNPLEYMKKKLHQYAEIDGVFHYLEGMGGVLFGDEYAKEGGDVRPASLNMSSLTEEEHALIQKELMPLYEQFLES